MWKGLTRVAIVGFLVAVAHARDASPAQPGLASVQRPFAGLKPFATIQVGKTADWVAITADAVWVGSTAPNAVHRIDPTTNREVARVTVPGKPCAGLVPGFGSLWVPLCARQARTCESRSGLESPGRRARIRYRGGMWDHRFRRQHLVGCRRPGHPRPDRSGQGVDRSDGASCRPAPAIRATATELSG